MHLKDLTTLKDCAKFIGIDDTKIIVSGLPVDLEVFTLGMAHRAIICEALNKIDFPRVKRVMPRYDEFSEIKYTLRVIPSEDGIEGTDKDFYLPFYMATPYVGFHLALGSPQRVEHMMKYFRQVLIDTMVLDPAKAALAERNKTSPGNYETGEKPNRLPKSQLSYERVTMKAFLSQDNASLSILSDAAEQVKSLVQAVPAEQHYCKVGGVFSLAFEVPCSELDSEFIKHLEKASAGVWRYILRAYQDELLLFVQPYPDYVREAAAQKR